MLTYSIIHTILFLILRSRKIGENRMSQLSKVAKHLRRNSKGRGITVAALARAAGVPRDTVYKRVSDLRILEGATIYSNYRKVNGQRKLYYRFAV